MSERPSEAAAAQIQRNGKLEPGKRISRGKSFFDQWIQL
jgi:hypothetical protein